MKAEMEEKISIKENDSNFLRRHGRIWKRHGKDTRID